jgi:hypothetical protein
MIPIVSALISEVHGMIGAETNPPIRKADAPPNSVEEARG